MNGSGGNGVGRAVAVTASVADAGRHLTLRQKRMITGRFVKTGRLKGVQRGRVMPVYRARVYAGNAAGSTDRRQGGRRGRGR